MGTPLRALIAATLGAMDDGQFQDFCLRILPILDERFIGLVRFGGTAEGKARPGVPDLILDHNDRSQTGVECSTEKGYWGPTNDITTLKPYVDLTKCVARLRKPRELVAVSNREIPARAVNVKADICHALSSSTRALITLIDGSELADTVSLLVGNPKAGQVFKEFFPEVAEYIAASEYRKRYELAEQVSRLNLPPLAVLMQSVDAAIASGLDPEESQHFVIAQLEESAAYKVASIAPFEGTVRPSVLSMPLSSPLGKLWQLVGPPKVGKSQIVRQLASTWGKDSIVLFDIPSDPPSSTANAIAEAIRRIGARGAPARSVGMGDAASDGEQEPTQPPPIIVIDNAERLTSAGLRSVLEAATELRSQLAGRMAFIVVSNRRLPEIPTAEVLQAPPWTSEELGDLLKANGYSAIAEPKYLELLSTIAGGHPLIALAIAGRAPSINDLVMSGFSTYAPQGDELSNEVHYFLIHELLSDADARTFAARLSVLIGRHRRPVLQVIAEVDPVVRTPVPLLLEQLEKVGIEGDDKAGYGVPTIFREPLRPFLSDAEKQKVYKAVAAELLATRGNRISVEDIASGALHAILGGDPGVATMRLALLYHLALRQGLDHAQLRALLGHTDLVRTILLRNQDRDAFGLLAMHVGVTGIYLRLGEFAKATEELNEGLSLAGKPGELPEDLNGFKVGLVVLAALDGAETDPGMSLRRLADITPGEWAWATEEIRATAIALAAALVGRSPWSSAVPTVGRLMTDEVGLHVKECLSKAIDLAAAIAVAGLKEGLAVSELECLDAAGPNGRVLRAFGRGIFFTERGDAVSGVKEHADAIEAAKTAGVSDADIRSRLALALGDAAYKADDRDLALRAYEDSLREAEPDSFTSAWSRWRIGLLRQDPSILAVAADALLRLGYEESWGRARGASGALFVKQGNVGGGLAALAEVIERFYSGAETVGPAAVVALAHLARISITGESQIVPDSGFPELGSEPYESVIHEARPARGVTFAGMLVARVFAQNGNDIEARNWLSRAVEKNPEATDIDAAGYVVRKLLEYETQGTGTISEDRAERYVDLIFLQEATGSALSRRGLALLLFAPVDLELAEKQKTTNIALLADAVEARKRASETDSDWWLAEVELRRARVSEVQKEHGRMVAEHFRRALRFAKSGQNNAVLIAAGEQLGFRWVEGAQSIREITESQYAILKGIEGDGQSLARLEVLGRNLFTLWSAFEFRRLSENDLEAKRLLRDSAREAEAAGISAENAAPAMLLLLAKLFRHDGGATAWAAEQLKRVGGSAVLPKSVRDRLEET